jgi:hypothetical protein
MKRTLLALVIAFGLCTAASAQNGKAIYFEIGGPGVASFNFDIRLTGRPDGIGVRGGIGGFSVNDKTIMYFPAEVNYLLGKDNKNYFEMGAGVTIVNYSDRYSDPQYDSHNGEFERSFGHLYFGYRRQPTKGGFLFRAGITPIFNITEHNKFFIPYYGGVSFGYAF